MVRADVLYGQVDAAMKVSDATKDAHGKVSIHPREVFALPTAIPTCSCSGVRLHCAGETPPEMLRPNAYILPV